jgi:DNA-binding response OmpR family regulator
VVRILIVEDEPHITFSLQLLLQRSGYEVSLASDGEQGLAMARDHRPDVVLLDIMMPKRNGYEVCQTLKADPDPGVRAIPIIMLTAKGQQLEVAQGLDIGAAAYVVKPFGNADILDTIRGVLESS